MSKPRVCHVSKHTLEIGENVEKGCTASPSLNIGIRDSFLYNLEERKKSMNNRLRIPKVPKTCQSNIEDLDKRFIDHLMSIDASASTRTSMLRKLHSIINKYGISEPTLNNWNRLLKALITNGCSNNTKMTYFYVLQHWALAIGYPELQRPKIDAVTKLPEPVTPEEFSSLLKVVDSLNDEIVLYLLFYTGMRANEISNIYLEDVDMKEGFIRVREHDDHTIKNRMERVIPIHPELKPVLNAWREQRKQMTILYKINKPYFILNQIGEQIKYNSMDYIVKKLSEKAGIRPLSCHKFRHAFCTLMERNNASVRMMQSLMGHKNVASTMRYIHEDTKEMQRTFSKFTFKM